MKKFLIGIWFMLGLSYAVFAQNTTIDCSKKYQTIYGLGVNINPQSWNVNPEAVKNVIDSLVTGMGCTSFRLMFDDSDWEVVNDNNDPNSYNWTYYDSVYSAPRFTCVWNAINYLNSKGITDITLSPDGAAPGWMGGTKLLQGLEEEYAEMMASMVYYGRNRYKPTIQFSMLSPVNETTCGGNEGPLMTPEQVGAIFSDIAKHLINDGIKDVTLTGPDDCYNFSNVEEILKNRRTMSKVKYLGGHQYGDDTSRSRELIDAIRNSEYPDREVIMSEVNAICRGCDDGEYNADYGFNNYSGPAYKDVLQHLNGGVAGIQIWEGYDSQYHHPKRTLTWSMWGIFAINDTLHPDVYTVRPHYYVLKQLFKFVKPGYQRIDISTTLKDLTVSAFFNESDGTVVITGKNNTDISQSLEGLLESTPALSKLNYFYTDANHNFSRGADAIVIKERFSKVISPLCAFTLVGN